MVPTPKGQRVAIHQIPTPNGLKHVNYMVPTPIELNYAKHYYLNCVHPKGAKV